jgi:NADH dehydrogenase
MPETTKVLIIGAGFAGIQVAMELERRFHDDNNVKITLVSRDNFVLFTPMLHEVAASDLDPAAIVNPVRRMLRRAQFIASDVESIDLERKQVTVTHGFHRHKHNLNYDHLVLALGSVANFYGIEGLEARALTMKSLEDAMKLRSRMVAHLEEADPLCSKVPSSSLLTLVVAGGGFAGVETVGGMHDFIMHALRSYSNLRPEMVRIVLVHPGEYLLPELGERLGRYTQDKLEKRGIEVRTGVKVTSISDEGVVLSDGSSIPTMCVVWTAGTAPSPQVVGLPCRKHAGRVLTRFGDGEGLATLPRSDGIRLPSGQGKPLDASEILLILQFVIERKSETVLDVVFRNAIFNLPDVGWVGIAPALAATLLRETGNVAQTFAPCVISIECEALREASLKRCL